MCGSAKWAREEGPGTWKVGAVNISTSVYKLATYE